MAAPARTQPPLLQPASASSVCCCAICLYGAQQPVATLCGHIFCSGCLQRWSNRNTTCPVCKDVRGDIKNAVKLYGMTESNPNSDARSVFGDELPAETIAAEMQGACAICHEMVQSLCIKCLNTPAASRTECLITKSVHCVHVYHHHCMYRWLASGGRLGCPLDDVPWVVCPTVRDRLPFNIRVHVEGCADVQFHYAVDNLPYNATVGTLFDRLQVCGLSPRTLFIFDKQYDRGEARTLKELGVNPDARVTLALVIGA